MDIDKTEEENDYFGTFLNYSMSFFEKTASLVDQEQKFASHIGNAAAGM